MSTTDALRIQLDNLRHEVQRLEVENNRLREEQEENETTEQREQLEQEVEELRQSLHEVQEREVSSNEKLVSSREERDKLQHENEQLAHELAQSRARCKDVSNDLKRVLESVELERYRFVEAECAKWEARELRLVDELEAARAPQDVPSDRARDLLSLHSSCSSLNSPTPVQMTTVVDVPMSQSADPMFVMSVHTSMDPTVAAFVLQPVSSVSSVYNGNLFPQMSISSHSAHTSVVSGHSHPRTEPPLILPTVPHSTVVPAVSFASDGSHFPVRSLLHAPTLQLLSTRPTTDYSASGIGKLTTGNLLPAPATSHSLPVERTGSSGGMATQESATSLPCGPLFAGSQLPPISKFSGEEHDGEGGDFEEWIEQFELVGFTSMTCQLDYTSSWNSIFVLSYLLTRTEGKL